MRSKCFNDPNMRGALKNEALDKCSEIYKSDYNNLSRICYGEEYFTNISGFSNYNYYEI